MPSPSVKDRPIAENGYTLQPDADWFVRRSAAQRRCRAGRRCTSAEIESEIRALLGMESSLDCSDESSCESDRKEEEQQRIVEERNAWLAGIAEARRRQRKELEPLPDFNVLKDIPPSPNFEATEISLLDSFASPSCYTKESSKIDVTYTEEPEPAKDQENIMPTKELNAGDRRRRKSSVPVATVNREKTAAVQENITAVRSSRDSDGFTPGKCQMEEGDHESVGDRIIRIAAVRERQRQEREGRPDFNILTDVAPPPDFEVPEISLFDITLEPQQNNRSSRISKSDIGGYQTTQSLESITPERDIPDPDKVCADGNKRKSYSAVDVIDAEESAATDETVPMESDIDGVNRFESEGSETVKGQEDVLKKSDVVSANSTSSRRDERKSMPATMVSDSTAPDRRQNKSLSAAVNSKGMVSGRKKRASSPEIVIDWDASDDAELRGATPVGSISNDVVVNEPVSNQLKDVSGRGGKTKEHDIEGRAVGGIASEEKFICSRTREIIESESEPEPMDIDSSSFLNEVQLAHNAYSEANVKMGCSHMFVTKIGSKEVVHEQECAFPIRATNHEVESSIPAAQFQHQPRVSKQSQPQGSQPSLADAELLNVTYTVEDKDQGKDLSALDNVGSYWGDAQEMIPKSRWDVDVSLASKLSGVDNATAELPGMVETTVDISAFEAKHPGTPAVMQATFDQSAISSSSNASSNANNMDGTARNVENKFDLSRRTAISFRTPMRASKWAPTARKDVSRLHREMEYKSPGRGTSTPVSFLVDSGTHVCSRYAAHQASAERRISEQRRPLTPKPTKPRLTSLRGEGKEDQEMISVSPATRIRASSKINPAKEDSRSPFRIPKIPMPSASLTAIADYESPSSDSQTPSRIESTDGSSGSSTVICPIDSLRSSPLKTAIKFPVPAPHSSQNAGRCLRGSRPITGTPRPRTCTDAACARAFAEVEASERDDMENDQQGVMQSPLPLVFDMSQMVCEAVAASGPINRFRPPIRNRKNTAPLPVRLDFSDDDSDSGSCEQQPEVTRVDTTKDRAEQEKQHASELVFDATNPSIPVSQTAKPVFIDTTALREFRNSEVEEGPVEPDADLSATANIVHREEVDETLQVIIGSEDGDDEDVEELIHSAGNMSFEDISEQGDFYEQNSSASVCTSAGVVLQNTADNRNTASATLLDDSTVTVGTPGIERKTLYRSSSRESVTSDQPTALATPMGQTDSSFEERSEEPIHLVAARRREKPDAVLAPRKIIHPEKDDAVGLRRSARNRLPPVRHWLSERPIYAVDSQGNCELVGVSEVHVRDPLFVKYGTANPKEVFEKQAKEKKQRKMRCELKKKYASKVQRAGTQDCSDSSEEDEDSKSGNGGSDGR